MLRILARKRFNYVDAAVIAVLAGMDLSPLAFIVWAILGFAVATAVEAMAEIEA